MSADRSYRVLTGESIGVIAGNCREGRSGHLSANRNQRGTRCGIVIRGVIRDSGDRRIIRGEGIPWSFERCTQ